MFWIMVFLKFRWGREVSTFDMYIFTQTPFSALNHSVCSSSHSPETLFYTCPRRKPPFLVRSWGETVTCCTESGKGSGTCLFHLPHLCIPFQSYLGQQFLSLSRVLRYKLGWHCALSALLAFLSIISIWDSPEDFIKMQIDPMNPCWNLRFCNCIHNKLLDDAYATVPWTTLLSSKMLSHLPFIQLFF